jgi:hypothetical protein
MTTLSFAICGGLVMVYERVARSMNVSARQISFPVAASSATRNPSSVPT